MSRVPLSGVVWLVVILTVLVFLSTHAAAHDMYRDWKIPGTDASCCNERDCGPTRARQTYDGGWQVWHSGKWLDVPPEARLPFPSPDGRSYACIIGQVVRCFVPGEVRS